MRYYILKITTRGIKNIENDLTLSFYPQTISDTLNIKETNVKAIFGMNGSGKSAIIKSVKMYKDLITIKNYLSKATSEYLDNLINKKTRSFYFHIIYALYDETKNNAIVDVYSHSILVINENGIYKIAEEKFSKLSKKSRTINEEYDFIFGTNNGRLKINEDEYSKFLLEKSINLLNDSSLFAIAMYVIFEGNLSNIYQYPSYFDISSGYLFGPFINTFVDLDNQNDSDIRIKNNIINNFYYINSNKGQFNTNININYKLSNKKDAKDFESQLKKLEKFIKLFKPSLKEINYNKKIVKDLYYYSIIFVYEEYSIDLDFESTGIKKLTSLFQYLQNASNGGIVFIDELDSNLHDVYLSKLVKYFENYGVGQLCFTSHNLGTMNELKDYNNSIDFISENTEIVSWKKSGNYSPYNQYRSGMIKGSPLNIEDFDFLSVFGNGEE